jgi:hypothetical protein
LNRVKHDTPITGTGNLRAKEEVMKIEKKWGWA